MCMRAIIEIENCQIPLKELVQRLKWFNLKGYDVWFEGNAKIVMTRTNEVIIEK